MKRICAWCGQTLGYVDSEAWAEDIITHGLCEDCAFHLFAQAGMPLQQYLDGLAAPVVVVDASGTVKTANGRARALLQKDLSAIEGYKGGDVFECAYAELPEGCGYTVHCSGCTITRVVMETFDTGQSKLEVPAILNRGRAGEPERIEFLISTERAGDVILLRIDAVGDQEV